MGTGLIALGSYLCLGYRVEIADGAEIAASQGLPGFSSKDCKNAAIAAKSIPACSASLSRDEGREFPGKPGL